MNNLLNLLKKDQTIFRYLWNGEADRAVRRKIIIFSADVAWSNLVILCRFCGASYVHYIEVVIFDSRRSSTFLRRAEQWQHATAISRSVNDDGMLGPIGLSPFSLSLSLPHFVSFSFLHRVFVIFLRFVTQARELLLLKTTGCVVYNSYTCTFGLLRHQAVLDAENFSKTSTTENITFVWLLYYCTLLYFISTLHGKNGLAEISKNLAR